MITKTVIKDFVAKRCPYLAYLELEDKTLVQLLEQSIDNQEKYEELLLEASENGEEAPKQQTVKRSTPKVGRNDPCPCGSGLKYKKCCGK